MPYAVDGEKGYRFTVRWGAETDTDDAEGRTVTTSDGASGARARSRRCCRDFTGEIMQTPPAFSAIKVDGERAYDLAREGEIVELEARARPASIGWSWSRCPMRDTAVFEADCGKGTYVRALARDMGRALGCLGHVIALRRTRVAGFSEAEAVTMEALQAAAEAGRRGRSGCCCRSRQRCTSLPCSTSARTTPRACCAGRPC